MILRGKKMSGEKNIFNPQIWNKWIFFFQDSFFFSWLKLSGKKKTLAILLQQGRVKLLLWYPWFNNKNYLQCKKKKNPLEIIFVFCKKNLKSHVFSLTEKKKRIWKKIWKKFPPVLKSQTLNRNWFKSD